MKLENIIETSDSKLVKEIINKCCKFWRKINPNKIKGGMYVAKVITEPYSFGGIHMIREGGSLPKVHGTKKNFEFGKIEKVGKIERKQTNLNCYDSTVREDVVVIKKLYFMTTEPVISASLNFCQDNVAGVFGAHSIGLIEKLREGRVYKNDEGYSIDTFDSPTEKVSFYKINEDDYRAVKKLAEVWKES